MLRADEANPFDIWVDEQRLTKSPGAAFNSYSWPEVRYVRFPSRGDKKPVAAKMLLPPGYKPDAKLAQPLPAVVYIHGAGIATSVLEQWGSYNEYRYVFNAFLASRGYVVLDIDYRGSTGYGRDWRSDVYLHMGGKDLEDVLGGVDYLQSLGNIDVNRVGIWGVSYGGFMTAMAMFQAPGTFKAGSSWASVNDWENYNAVYTQQRLGTPERNPEAYRRSSPIHFSNRLQDKLLIVHGIVDDNVMFQDAVQLTEKLVQERKDFSHIFYPQESHAFIRDETWIDAVRRTFDWFERYLR
jgi:dipeptidyl aminopeptidase/acylaminoacyl peptidase